MASADEKICDRIIRIDNLSHEYVRSDEEGNEVERILAVDGVSLEVKAGEFIAILGHNGSGKSTLAKHLNALLFPTGGAVWIDGKDTSVEDNIWDVRQSAGMIFQNPDNQIIAPVVEEDVAFGPENLGVPTEEIVKRVEQALKMVSMYEYREDSPGRLSGGQKQRVSIAGVIAMKPKCLIMDEPTAMLDPGGRREVIGAARLLNEKDNITVILITHYMEEAIEADRIFVMDQGKVALSGTPHEVFANVDRMKALHLDVPQVTLLAHELRERRIMVPADVITEDELADTLTQLLEAAQEQPQAYQQSLASERERLQCSPQSFEAGQKQPPSSEQPFAQEPEQQETLLQSPAARSSQSDNESSTGENAENTEGGRDGNPA